MNKPEPLVLSFTFMVLGSGFLGCGPDRSFEMALRSEGKEQYQKAWGLYQEFAAKYPKHSRAAEAIYRAGWLAQRQLKDCTVAKAFYDTVVRRYPQSDPWAKQAAYFKNNCPDYFPLVEGSKWVEGDSETHGKNARIETVAGATKGKEETSGIMRTLERTYYAGSSKFKTIELIYKKNGQELIEYVSKDDPRGKTILMWPLEVGKTWVAKMGGKTFRYEIMATDKNIKVEAGEFNGCLQVRSTIEGLTGATNEYYAPDVGRILVTLSTKEGEKRNTELISFKMSVPGLQRKDSNR